MPYRGRAGRQEGGFCQARNVIMSTKVYARGLLAATALTGVLGGVLLGATSARAQDPEASIGSIEKQIHALQRQLDTMKRSLSSRDAEVRAARAEAAAANRQAIAVSERQTNSLGQPLAPQPLSAPPGYQVNIADPARSRNTDPTSMWTACRRRCCIPGRSSSRASSRSARCG